MVKKAQQRLFNLRRLKKFGLAPKTLTNFYRCTITAWYGNCTDHNLRVHQSLPNASLGANYLPSRTPIAPDVTVRPKRSPISASTVKGDSGMLVF